MPTEDPNKLDVSKEQPRATEKVESPELSDDDLKTVSGGLTSFGTTLTSEPCCITSIG